MKKTNKIIFSIFMLAFLLTNRKDAIAQTHSIHLNADYTLHKLMLDASYNLRIGKRGELVVGFGYHWGTFSSKSDTNTWQRNISDAYYLYGGVSGCYEGGLDLQTAFGYPGHPFPGSFVLSYNDKFAGVYSRIGYRYFFSKNINYSNPNLAGFFLGGSIIMVQAKNDFTFYLKNQRVNNYATGGGKGVDKFVDAGVGLESGYRYYFDNNFSIEGSLKLVDYFQWLSYDLKTAKYISGLDYNHHYTYSNIHPEISLSFGYTFYSDMDPYNKH